MLVSGTEPITPARVFVTGHQLVSRRMHQRCHVSACTFLTCPFDTSCSMLLVDSRVLLQTQIKGTGEHLGIAAAWEVTFRPDGAFHCKVDAPPVESQFGWNGVVGAASWERESGIVRQLMYDDHEVGPISARPVLHAKFW